MASRLDRLVLLLDTGSASGIRTTAAMQLGDIMKQHPNELRNLLSRVSVHLRSLSWETRIAAGQAIGAIAKNATSWDPEVKLEDYPVPEVATKSALFFKDFDIELVMKNGKKLLGSAGQEYDLDTSNMTATERLMHLKKNLKKRLGFEIEFLEDDLVDDSDIFIKPDTSASMIPPENEIDMSALSARERNRLKRKNKKDAKDKMTEARKRIQTPQRRATIDSQIKPMTKSENDIEDTKVIIESKVSMEIVEDPRDWPFEDFCETLCVDLFDPNWVVRHGAAIALREILKYHGKDAGKVVGLSPDKNEILHNEWLEDACVRLLCVFALDRFGDFVSDQVVAPVRETCSQTLGTLIQYLPPDLVYHAQNALLKLIFQNGPNSFGLPQWEARHAGLLGLKYLIAVRIDLVENLLKGSIDAIFLGLRDVDDDVRGVSASSLLPVTQQFVEFMPEKVLEISATLWTCLRELKDDLSASTGSVMDLIAKLFSYPTILRSFSESSAQNPEFSLNNLVPILFPFFRHTISSVRLAVLTTLKLFLGADDQCGWVDDRVFRLIFQNIMVEEKLNILNESESLWNLIMTKISASPEAFYAVIRECVPKWLTSMMTPMGTPIDESLFFLPKASLGSSGQHGTGLEMAHNIDIGMLTQDFSLIPEDIIIRNRLACAKALGIMLKVLPIEEIALLFDGSLRFYVHSAWGFHQQLSSALIEEWFSDNPAMLLNQPVKESLSHMLLDQLDKNSHLTFSECTVHLKRLRSECLALLNTATMDGGVDPSTIPTLPNFVDGEAEPGFTVETAKYFASSVYSGLIQAAHRNSLANLEDRNRRVLTAIGVYEEYNAKIETQINSAIACAVVGLETLPIKLNPIIRSIMNSIKFETSPGLQLRSAIGISKFVYLCSKIKPKINPTDKIVKNLCAFICSDVSVAPSLEENTTKLGIYSLMLTHVPPAKVRGRPATHDTSVVDGERLKAAKLVRRGSEMALEQFCNTCGLEVFSCIPKLWEIIFITLQNLLGGDLNEVNLALEADIELGQSIIDSLQVLSSISIFVHPDLLFSLEPTIPWIIRCLQSPYSVLRHIAAKCFSTLSYTLLSPCMKSLISLGLPLLMDHTNVVNRQGVAEAIYFTVQALGTKVLPYVIFLVVPILGRMSDNDDHVRLIASNCFALLINLIPLESGIPDPEDFPAELIEQRSSERKFLNQLLDVSQVENFEMPIKVNAELRSYQQEGVSWLAFLNRYQLHGILCDDMGLGKTLQSICILSSDHYLRTAKFEQTQNPDSAHLPSLVICPPTLIGHWIHEIKNYASNLNPLCYTGVSAERKRLLPKVAEHDVIVMSYDIIRNDIDELSKQMWNYCILDEGHIIKNGKTKITKAIKMIKANHRLILSGTPIQNNVLELWSLFDFLMPGFLGTEKAFNDRYSRPILASKEAKSSSREQEAGALALEALHKQVLPFLLRRLKEDVLDDLPPKIIQDYYCELSEIQKDLYDEFSKLQKSGEALQGEGEEEGPKKVPHVFQALQYLRKLCNHPLLVMSPKHPQFNSVMRKVGEPSRLHDLNHAPKLLALKQLLNDCGIGVSNDGSEDQLVSGAVSQHRVLIFCQLKTMLDLVETDLLKKHLPSVTYMRMDGSVDSMKRHDIVQKFNADPSIDVLLLTTHVGGLGLNLTGADTVIFVEHDWNPMKDLQAMDRAHRIGQKKVVNVYRLIARGTLEEKIMGLQKFKLNIANSIVNQQNSGLKSMATNQLLELFNPPSDTIQINQTDSVDPDAIASAETGNSTFKKALEGLDKLWDEKQYEEEFDLDQFIENLKG